MSRSVFGILQGQTLRLPRAGGHGGRANTRSDPARQNGSLVTPGSAVTPSTPWERGRPRTSEGAPASSRRTDFDFDDVPPAYGTACGRPGSPALRVGAAPRGCPRRPLHLVSYPAGFNMPAPPGSAGVLARNQRGCAGFQPAHRFRSRSRSRFRFRWHPARLW